MCKCKMIMRLIFITAVLSSCNIQKGTKNASKSSQSVISSVSVSNIQFVNHQLIITGKNLDQVKNIAAEGANINEVFTIESKSYSQIIANSIRNVSIGVNSVFNLVLANAEGAATFPVSFSLAD